MLTFTVTNAGQSLLNSATEGTSPVIISAIALCKGESASELTAMTTIEEPNFIGCVVHDDNDNGNYLVVDFENTVNLTDPITFIKLKAYSGNSNEQIDLAVSEEVQIIKREGLRQKIRLTCQFAGAEKCGFSTTSINLPYATENRAGVIRLTSAQDIENDEANHNSVNKSRTVYSAKAVEDYVSQYISGTDQYVPWDTSGSPATPVQGSLTADTLNLVDDYSTPTQTATITVTSGGAISIDNQVTGNAVSTSPTITGEVGSRAITHTGDLVTDDYIASLYADSVSSANSNKLVTSNAVSAAISEAGANYVHLTGNETVAGTKTFSDATVFSTSVSSPSYIGSGVQSEYSTTSGGEETITWNLQANADKLPTVYVVDRALDHVTDLYTAADSNLQSQIDGINAGQNLADIINSRGDDNTASRVDDLANLDATNLDVGDKVQVLHDKTITDGSIDTTQGYTGVSTVYTLVQGTPTSGTRDVAAHNKSGYYWHYVGEYGVDAYTKSQSDTLFVSKAGLDQSITSSSVSTNAPSSAAVWNLVDSVVDSLDDYVTIATDQTITGEKTFENTYINVADPNNANHYANFYINTNSSTGTTRAMQNFYNVDKYAMADSQFECSGGVDNIFYYQELFSYTANDQENPRACSAVSQSAMQHYGVIISDVYLATDDRATMPGPYAEAYKIATGNDFVDNYQERIRLRKTTSTSDATDVNTYIDLYADHITALGNDIHFKTFVSNTPTDILTISNSTGVYSTKFAGGYVISGTYYPFGTAGSLTTDTSITNAADNSHAPTSLAVKTYVNDAIAGAQEAVITTISNSNVVGSMGLFIFTQPGDQLPFGSVVNGTYLKPVGMSLPMSGQISYKAVALLDPDAPTGSWKLLSVAMKRTVTEPCLVLAQKVSNDAPA